MKSRQTLGKFARHDCKRHHLSCEWERSDSDEGWGKIGSATFLVDWDDLFMKYKTRKYSLVHMHTSIKISQTGFVNQGVSKNGYCETCENEHFSQNACYSLWNMQSSMVKNKECAWSRNCAGQESNVKFEHFWHNMGTSSYLQRSASIQPRTSPKYNYKISMIFVSFTKKILNNFVFGAASPSSTKNSCEDF